MDAPIKTSKVEEDTEGSGNDQRSDLLHEKYPQKPREFIWRSRSGINVSNLRPSDSGFFFFSSSVSKKVDPVSHTFLVWECALNSRHLGDTEGRRPTTINLYLIKRLSGPPRPQTFLFSGTSIEARSHIPKKNPEDLFGSIWKTVLMGIVFR